MNAAEEKRFFAPTIPELVFADLLPEKEDQLMIRRRKVDDRIWRANKEREIVASEPKIAFRCNNR